MFLRPPIFRPVGNSTGFEMSFVNWSKMVKIVFNCQEEICFCAFSQLVRINRMSGYEIVKCNVYAVVRPNWKLCESSWLQISR